MQSYCMERGNTYVAIGSSGCANYTVAAAGVPPTLKQCPAGLLFDVSVCTCNWAKEVNCYGQYTVLKSKGFCQARGNTFKIRESTNCKQYTVETSALSATTLSCPDDLVFDINACVCNWESKVNCEKDSDVVG